MRKRSLKRRAPTREPKARITILTEGKNTEPQYFNAVRNLYREALVDIEIIGAVGTPLTIAESARAKKKSRKNDSFELNDEVWAVFDKDEHPDISKALELCRNAGVGIGYSNPCFELWLILHISDYDKPNHHRDVQKHLETIHGAYSSSGGKTVDVGGLLPALEQAEARAEALLKRRDQEGSPYGNPSSTVGKLTTSIRCAAKKFQSKSR